MARKRYTEEQIIAVLNEAEAGAKTSELCRRHGMSEATFYKWKAKYAGLTLNELKRLRSRDEEKAQRSGKSSGGHSFLTSGGSWISSLTVRCPVGASVHWQ